MARRSTRSVLVKAAHLYWQAQSVYQTPTTNFNDHADALQAACQDLDRCSTGRLEHDQYTRRTLGTVDHSCRLRGKWMKMIEAVELRIDPAAQCNFQPMLQQNPPPLCTNTKNPPTFYHENFEDGLAGWTLTNQGVFSGWPGLDWT